MAGLGKGLGELLSESRNKKARQQNKSVDAVVEVEATLEAVAKPKAKRTSRTKSTAETTKTTTTATKTRARKISSETKKIASSSRSRKKTTTESKVELSSVASAAKEVAQEQALQENIALKGITNSTSENAIASDDHLVLNINLEMLKPSAYQPRHSFDDDAIMELATSIKEHGLLEPLIVKRINGGYYEIICGERRYRAARMLSMPAVPCLVREVVDEKAYAIALIENIQRENLNPVELAIAFDQMMHECGMTQEEVAKSVCKSRSAVANYLRMLKLDDDALSALRTGKIDLGHAKVLLSLNGSAQSEACQVVIERGLSVRATESFVKEFIKKLEAKASEEPPTPVKTSNKVFNYSAYEKMLNSKLQGAKAKFKTTKDGKGKLTLSYNNEQELSSLLLALGLSE